MSDRATASDPNQPLARDAQSTRDLRRVARRHCGNGDRQSASDRNRQAPSGSAHKEAHGALADRHLLFDYRDDAFVSGVFLVPACHCESFIVDKKEPAAWNDRHASIGSARLAAPFAALVDVNVDLGTPHRLVYTLDPVGGCLLDDHFVGHDCVLAHHDLFVAFGH